jgi:alkane 1-monooxygenase
MACLYRSGKSFWLSLSLPLICALLCATGHAWIFVAITLLIIPALDAFLGRGSPMHGAQFERSTARQIPCWYALSWAAALGVAAYKSITAPWLQFIGSVIACGVLSATAMAHLHELGHRSSVPWRAFTDVAFAIAGYPHYRYAHELHHSHLGNPRFGSTASIGTSSWYNAGPSYIRALRASLDPISYKSRTVPRRLLVHRKRPAKSGVSSIRGRVVPSYAEAIRRSGRPAVSAVA